MLNRDLPPFYVITVNYHSGLHLPGLTASLSPLPFVKKLIIINHSPEESLAGLKTSFPVQVIVQDNAGYGAGLNRGLREIGEKNAVALLCNPDIALLTPEKVAEALAFMVAHPGVGCLIPRSVDENGQVIPTCRTFYSWKTILASRIGIFRRAFAGPYPQHLFLETGSSRPVEVDWGCGAAIFYRVSAFGGGPAFDEDFFLYLEDVDLCARLWRAGLSVVYYPELLYRHQWQGQSRFRWRFFLYHLLSLGKFIRKYRGLPQRGDLQGRERGLQKCF
jgi:GT2 family glycosyltransferase